jgi:hypothetical protein
VVVGGHAAHVTRQIFGQLWLWQSAHPNGEAVLSSAKLQVLHDAALAKCDRLDGVRDGLLENPLRCRFDPKEVACRAGDGPNCLTAPQVEAARRIYAGPTNPRTNAPVWSPLYRGSELDWSFFTEATGPIGIATSTLRDAVLKDPTWDYRTSPTDYDRHVALADQADIARVNASLYERFAPQDADGRATPTGMRAFVVGTGGAGLYGVALPRPNSEARHHQGWGVLKLTLLGDGYDWEFVPVGGSRFRDFGHAGCGP